jgi:hypothetical protein
MNIDFKYMSRALELAKLGIGNVAPNPMVGCVIVHNDKIIGETVGVGIALISLILLKAWDNRVQSHDTQQSE